MRPLSLDFASKQRSLTARKVFPGIVILLAGILSISSIFWQYQHQQAIKSGLQARLGSLKQHAQKLHTNTPLPPELLTQIEQANLVYAQIQTPWEKIFTALESSRVKSANDIALLSIKADATKRILTLTGEARDFNALNKFTGTLSDSATFENTVLTNDKLSTGSPPIVVNFELRLTWRTEDNRHP
jgi:Tfp pilus assembly protein PilN